MPEPRYDFCLAVVRKHGYGGFEIHKVFLVYVPEMPQQAGDRRSWLRSRERIEDISRQISSLLGGASINPRMRKSDYGELHLWAVVPMLSVTSAQVMRSAQYDRVPPRYYCMVYDAAQMSACNLSEFFRKLCVEFHKRGGGQFVVKQNKKEVSDYLL